MDTEDWRRELAAEREQKDEFLGEHQQSPLPGDARAAFEGLPYYDPDPDLRFEPSLEEHEDKAPVTVATTADNDQEYLRWGEFVFEVDGEQQSLEAYRSDPEEERLWVPFRDETNGEETYGGGRYLDLVDPEDRAGDEWVLDFNRAYTPFCVYSDLYECPMVPGENWLEVAIEAGEKVPYLDVGEGH
ncbi:hypothetical protein BRC81_02130 [Halobacteriales archaeon QS_1_68_20]|nr:MAG: hypothetical protein BRC81_02130 [Halobacteriales archaeon QS_1_68_20]